MNAPARVGDVVEPGNTLPVATGADDLIRTAIERGADVETMERLLAMRRELKAEAARKAYFDALAAFQSACPVIQRRKGIPDSVGEIKYRYAPLEHIVEQVGPLLRDHRLSYRFETEVGEGGALVSCIVTHRDGHSERSSVTVPGVSVPKANAAQNSGAGITYGKRQSFCNALGIMTADDDTDGRGPGVDDRPGDTITREQEADLECLITEVGADRSKVLAWLKVSHLANLPAAHYDNAVRGLEAKRKQQSTKESA